ncbi:MAG: C25 family cysteine peptidase, partial [Anaerolineae bacterium]
PPISATTPLTRVVVTDSGLYALTYDDLAAAGLPVATLDPRTLQLSHGQTRRPVAVWVEGESDGRLDPGDRLLFYAPPYFSRYSDTDVYFLSRGQSAGRRMAVQPGNPAGLPPGTPRLMATAEENHFYDSLYPARDGDRWYWMQLRRPNLITATVPVSLSSPLPAGPDAALTLWLQGYTNPAPNPDHRLAVAVNGAPAGQIEWNGDRAITATFAVSAARLHNGQNNITLSLPGVSGVLVEGMWLDALALTYPGHRAGDAPVTFTAPAGPMAYSLGGWAANDLSVYNITDPEAPQIVTGFTLTPSGNAYTLTVGTAGDAPQTFLAVPGGQVKSPVALQAARLLQDPPGGADYIIITHADFAPAVAPLAQHRAAQGLRVTTVDVQAVYDTFGGGRVGPEAIKAFLQRAFYTWTPPAPLYVLLVGDGSYDFKNHSGWNSPTFIPPYLAEVDPWLGETAADNRYVTVAGNDPLPDMLIGRLPVNTPAEAETVVDKIIRYETNPLPGGWNARQLIVSDNPDGGGTFYTDADWVYNIVSGALESYRFYYTPQPDALPHLYNNVDALRQAFLADLNFGAGMVTFHGHSSWHQWGVEQFFRWNRDPALNDVLALQNGYRLPLVLEMTCFTGYFHHPEYPTLDESLLRRAGGGAVAVWGATGLGVSTGHGALQAGFYRAVINRQETNLGAAALAGKANLYAAGGNLDLLDTFTLFGDPALTLNFTAVPFTGHAYLPFAARH